MGWVGGFFYVILKHSCVRLQKNIGCEALLVAFGHRLFFVRLGIRLVCRVIFVYSVVHNVSASTHFRAVFTLWVSVSTKLAKMQMFYALSFHSLILFVKPYNFNTFVLNFQVFS